MQESPAGDYPARQRSFVERMIGAAKLDVSVYEEVEHDRTATAQAAGVVALTAVCSAIGGLGSTSGKVPMAAMVMALMTWVIMAGLTYFIGTVMFGGTADMGEMLRTLGFSRAPGVFAALGFIPILGKLVLLAVWIWQLATAIVAIRQALDVDTGRAVATAALAWIAGLVASLALLFLVLGFGAFGAFLAH